MTSSHAKTLLLREAVVREPRGGLVYRKQLNHSVIDLTEKGDEINKEQERQREEKERANQLA